MRCAPGADGARTGAPRVGDALRLAPVAPGRRASVAQRPLAPQVALSVVRVHSHRRLARTAGVRRGRCTKTRIGPMESTT